MKIRSRLAIIPARGGSKAIPRKNLQMIGQFSLLERAIKSAQESNIFDEICVSTDDEEIAQKAISAGARVPFLRPINLAEDSSLTIDVIKHAINHYENMGQRFSFLTLLQPTTPFRKTEDLKFAHNIFENSNCDTLISVQDVTEIHKSTLYTTEQFLSERHQIVSSLDKASSISKGTRRQNFSRQYWRNGSIYIFRPSTLMHREFLISNPIMALKMNWLFSLNIDSLEQLDKARLIHKILKI